MKIVIPDDYQDVLPRLQCFAQMLSQIRIFEHLLV